MTLPLLLTVPFVGGCETTFEPFQESDRAFSLFGYLDAAADVQFVRVTPLRNSLYARRGTLDATVTLEHLASGQTSTWRDSVVFFGEAPAHNFWSAEPVELGQTYRMTVWRSDGAASAATFTLPDREPEPGAAFPMFSPTATVTIRKVDQLLKAELIYTVQILSSGDVAQRSFSYLDEASRYRDSDGDFGYTFSFDRAGIIERLAMTLGTPDFQVLALDLAVASAGPDWPDFATIDRETLALPDVIGNVEQGVGFVGGIVSKTVRILDNGEPSSKQ
ncbi:MAG: hypothetical protein ACR2GR_10835 [Rhodothermales bacterium]